MFYSFFILMPHLTSQKTREDHFTRTSEHHHHIYETLQPTYRPHQFAELKRKKKPVYNIIENLTFNILGLRLRDKTFHRALFPRILSLRECLTVYSNVNIFNFNMTSSFFQILSLRRLPSVPPRCSDTLWRRHICYRG